MPSTQSRGRSGNPAKARQRQTPQKPAAKGPSPLWVPTLMFALLACGIGVIVLNYFEVFPGGAENKLLLVGIIEVTLAFVVATAVR